MINLTPAKKESGGKNLIKLLFYANYPEQSPAPFSATDPAR